MKKLFCVLVMGVLAFAFASCKADCQCTISYKSGETVHVNKGSMTNKECVEEGTEIFDELIEVVKKVQCHQ
jgi:hypothetical protein